MLKLYAPGDKSRAICGDCGKMVATTFGYHDVPFSDGKGVAKNILAATCDVCGAVVAVPAQSTPAIAKAREQAETSIEILLPAPEMDILDAAAFLIDPQATVRFRKTLFTYYLALLDHHQELVDSLTMGVGAWIAEGKAVRDRARSQNVKIPTRRLSMKVASRTEDRFERVMVKSGLNKTEIARGIVMLVKHDLLEESSGSGKSRTMEELKLLASAVNG